MTNSDRSPARMCLRRALNLLEYRDRTERELYDRLIRDGYPENVVLDILDRVKSSGYLDDRRYAENYMRCRLDSKSRQQLFQALSRRGISSEVISSVWEDIYEEEQPDERELIRRLFLKRCGDRRELTREEYRRIQAFLARRGFSWDDVQSVFEELQIICVDNFHKKV